MRPRNIPDDLARVARRVVWYDTPETSLEDPAKFLAHVMTYGTIQDMVTTEKYFSAEDFRRALEKAPPGVFDPRSWAYWNTVFGRVPVPPMPKRKFLREEEMKARS
ncbi:MAG: hypothetical protein ACRD1R_02950 [Acidobacteriota bacterium]